MLADPREVLRDNPRDFEAYHRSVPAKTPPATYEYDAIAVLGAGIQRVGDHYAPTNSEQGDAHGLLWGKVRNDAAILLWAAQKTDTLVFVGGVTEPVNGRIPGQAIPTEAKVYRDDVEDEISFLRESKYTAPYLVGISDPEYIEIGRSSDTKGNIEALEQYAGLNDVGRIGVIGSDYQKEGRLELMTGHRQDLFVPLFAETIVYEEAKLAKLDTRWKKDRVYATFKGRTRQKNEERGVSALQLGTYKRKGLSHWQTEGKD